MTFVPFEFSLERTLRMLKFSLIQSLFAMNSTQTRWVVLPPGELEPCLGKQVDLRSDEERKQGHKIHLLKVVIDRKRHYVSVVCKQMKPTFACLISFETVLGYFDRNFRFNVDVSEHDIVAFAS